MQFRTTSLLLLVAFFLVSVSTKFVNGEIRPLWQDDNSCGKQLIDPKQNASTTTKAVSPFKKHRIVGGQEPSSPYAWPWMGAIFHGAEFRCGAVIIDPNIVVTSAHCMLEQKVDAFRVMTSSRLFRSQWHRQHTAGKFVVHPEFNEGFPAWANDIALLFLDDGVNMTTESAAVPCRPKYPAPVGQNCVVAGWGRLYENGPLSTDKLYEVTVPIMDSNVCNDASHYFNLIDPTMMCAGWEEGGKGVCDGDDGGPLVCEVDGRWTLHGIVSWGYGCAHPKKPGVYARVSVLSQWIDEEARKYFQSKKYKKTKA